MHKETKSFLIFIGVFFGLSITMIILTDIWPSISEQRFRRNAKRFNALNLNGRVDTFYYDRRGITLFLINDTTVYAFTENMKSFDDIEYPFSSIVIKGDSIIKLPNSDTIKVIKDGKELIYSFYKRESKDN